MLCSLRNVAHFYGPRLIFKGVNLDVRQGTVTLLAGPNGAGKSTLVKILAGLIRPASGERVCGQGKNGKDMAIGYLGHQTFLYPDLTALENLRFWAAMHALTPTDAELTAMLERMDLALFADEKARGFSRGMAQRLNLARVFLLAPDMLLLDEPGTGLDARSAAVLDREIAAAAAAGAGIVWISHSVDKDCHKADAVALLGQKKLLFSGTVAEFILFSNSGGPASFPDSGPDSAPDSGPDSTPDSSEQRAHGGQA